MITKATSLLRKILIADDDTNIRLLVRYTLEDTQRYEIAEATDGAETLENIRTQMPDLVILDLMMPRVSGLDVLESLNRNPPAHPPLIIVLSAKVNEEEHARKLGVEVFLRKPFSPLQLMAVVEQVLDNASH